MAVWVLAAHAYALLLPFLLWLAADRHWPYLAGVADWPGLLQPAAAVLVAASLCEVIQNHQDRWRLGPGMGSTGTPAVWDFLFHWLLVGGQALIAVALAGRATWVSLAAGGAVLAMPLLYRSTLRALPLAASGLLVALLAFRAFGDPVVFLQLGTAGLTLYFFTALLRTGAQWLHGCTTAAAASGLWFLLLALENGARHTAWSWAQVLGLTAAGLIAACLAWPWLSRRPATERV